MLDVFSGRLVNDPTWQKTQKATHTLDVFSGRLVNDPTWQKTQKATHMLDVFSGRLVNEPTCQITQKATHTLDMCFQADLLMIQLGRKHKSPLARWMCF